MLELELEPRVLTLHASELVPELFRFRRPSSDPLQACHTDLPLFELTIPFRVVAHAPIGDSRSASMQIMGR